LLVYGKRVIELLVMQLNLIGNKMVIDLNHRKSIPCDVNI
jgi:hypothetical protein